MKSLALLISFSFLTQFSFAQCTTFDATSCMCFDSVSTDCDLLPDIKVALAPLYVQGSSGVIEYSQSGNGANDGRLRVSVSTPNIGFGPLTVRTTTTYLCGTDTFVGTAPSQCPNGDPPRILVNQRVYHKNGTTMSYYDRAAGSMTYHPLHGHMHVDDWGIYTLRDSIPGESNPLNWTIIGTGSKLAFCLMDYGTCSFYNGHCTDDAGNTLVNSDFVNYGLGGGSYNCSSTEQGITSGYTDIYYQYLDGMWINIPPGTCNGDYHIVVHLDPYNYFIESNENNNVVAVPFTLTQQVPNGSAPTIATLGTTTVCTGNSVELVASTGDTYAWSTGDTTKSIDVTQSGSYFVTVSSGCGTGTSDSVTITVIDPQIMSVTHDTVAAGNNANLQASSNVGIVKWFDAAIGGTHLHTGTGFQTPLISNSTTYYAEATFNSTSATEFAAPHSNLIGSGAQHNVNTRYLIFDAHTTIVLESVKVYAFGAGFRTIELRNSSDVVLQTVTVNVPDGESRVSLGFIIQPGTNLRLGLSGSSASALFRNNSGVTFPYQITGFLDITGSSAGAQYYYFFYDWEVHTLGDSCSSASRSEVVAHVSLETQIDSVIHVTCNGGADGSIILSVNGGSLPYSYLWNDGVTIQNRNTLSANAYTLTITDNEGLSLETSATISQPSPISITTSKSNVSCNSSVNGSARVIVSGGIIPFGYSWNTNPVQTTNEITGIAGGSYTCVVTDQNGCTKSASVNIIDPQLLMVFSLPNNPGPGDINLLVTGAIAPYTYNWNTGSTAEDVFGLAPGFYFCQVADRNGCAKVHSVILSAPSNYISGGNNLQSKPGDNKLFSFELFPNPAENLLNISLTAAAESPCTINITDVRGGVLHSLIEYGVDGISTVTIDVEQLTRGFYFVQIVQDANIEVRHFIKQ